MADMIKFYKGLVSNLPETGANGALYITTDEGAIYLGTGTGMKRLGDFVQVDAVANLPEKAHATCLYYCVAENILAKWNGTEWKQINKQPTAEELKTLLGLGSLAYKSEVAEGDLNAALKEKVNAAAEGNHSHANKALLDTYTQTEADLADAVAKKHAHANADELAKIVDGDKAKWDAVAADHLTSTDKTNLENAIKDAKKAGTDANTALETYKVSNDARVKAVEDDIAEITDGTNGILAQAKAYADGKDGAIAEAKKAGTDAAAALETYKTANDSALAGVKATADAAAVKTEVETALAGKVDKVEGKSLIADSEIARLANVTNYDDTQVKADIAKKADAASVETELGKKVDKATGYSLVADDEIARLADVDNYDDTEVRGLIGDNADAIAAIAGDYVKSADIADFETKENVKKVSDDLGAYKTSNNEALADVKAIAEAATTVDEVNSQIDTKISALNLGTTYEPIGAEGRAKDYVDQKFTDANLAQYTTEQEVKDIVDEVIVNAVDGDTLTGLTNLVEYINTHGGEAAEMGAAIDVLEGKVEAIEGKPAYGITSTQISNWDNEVGAKELAASKTTTAEVKDQIEAYGYATTGYADGKAAAAQSAAEATAAGALATARTEITAEIDADVKVVNDALEAYKTSNNAEVAKKANSADVYAKSETFTKDEVNAAIAAAVEAAHTWGEF